MGEFEIRLENVRLFGRHGVFPEERRDGNDFEVNLLVRYKPLPASLTDDDIDKTVSYADLYDIVKEEMDLPRNLLETVAAAVAARVKTAYPFVSFVECRVTKLRPPIPSFSGQASVVYRIS